MRSIFLQSARAFFDLIDSDRRSKILFCRIVFRSTSVHLSGKCSSLLVLTLLAGCAPFSGETPYGSYRGFVIGGTIGSLPGWEALSASEEEAHCPQPTTRRGVSSCETKDNALRSTSIPAPGLTASTAR
jgi:hypothetical protein